MRLKVSPKTAPQASDVRPQRHGPFFTSPEAPTTASSTHLEELADVVVDKHRDDPHD